MRKKSESRRLAILQAAAELFRDTGFALTSMADICARVGCSKPTLYNYFESKEALFSAVVFDAARSEFQATLQALNPAGPDIAQALEQFGQRLIRLLYSPEVQARRRMVIAEASRSGLGPSCYEMGPARSEAAIAGLLQQAMDQGTLRKGNARVASAHLKGLLEAEWIEPFLFNTLPEISDAQIQASVARSVSVFMMAYGPTP